MRERIGFVILVALLQFGILSDELTRRNMEMFAAEVVPHFLTEMPAAIPPVAA